MRMATVVVSVLGEVFSWSDGYFSGSNENMAKQVRRAARLQVEPVRLHAMGEEVMPGEDTPRAAAAAMYSLDPGRARVLKGAELVFTDEEINFGSLPDEADAAENDD